jgi:hypothetical protein
VKCTNKFNAVIRLVCRLVEKMVVEMKNKNVERKLICVE